MTANQAASVVEALEMWLEARAALERHRGHGDKHHTMYLERDVSETREALEGALCTNTWKLGG